MKKNYICIMRKKNKEIKENKKQFEKTLSHFHEKYFIIVYTYVYSIYLVRQRKSTVSFPHKINKSLHT